MLLVAFSMEGGRDLPHEELWLLLAVAMVTTLVGASLMACFMVPEYRSTFYKVLRPIELVLAVAGGFSRPPPQTRNAQHQSFKMLVKWMWEDRIVCSRGAGADASRSMVRGRGSTPETKILTQICRISSY